MDALPRGTARIVTANPGPTLPLLHHVEGTNPYPIYTGPLGVARMFVLRDRHLMETCKYGMKWGAFLSTDPEGKHVEEFSVSYVSAEQALREVLGVYFTLAGFKSNDTALADAIRRYVTNELDHLNQPQGATT